MLKKRSIRHDCRYFFFELSRSFSLPSSFSKNLSSPLDPEMKKGKPENKVREEKNHQMKGQTSNNEEMANFVMIVTIKSRQLKPSRKKKKQKKQKEEEEEEE
jgi:hypothetical protein